VTQQTTPPARPAARPARSFEFVAVASARARQLLDGCVPRVEGSAKPARRAVQEVSAGVVGPTEPAAE
jgi:DNA-directed RNA polymerase subunit K/omega